MPLSKMWGGQMSHHPSGPSQWARCHSGSVSPSLSVDQLSTQDAAHSAAVGVFQADKENASSVLRTFKGGREREVLQRS